MNDIVNDMVDERSLLEKLFHNPTARAGDATHGMSVREEIKLFFSSHSHLLSS